MLLKGSKIGIMGGTFNPIHIGHLIIAEAARESLGLDSVVFVPASVPPHKQGMDIIDSVHRLEMVRCAVQSNPAFCVSDVELRRGGISYTYNTIRHFLDEGHEGENLFYITGADALVTIDTWKNHMELLSLCHFVAATRPGIGEHALLEKVSSLSSKGVTGLHPLLAPAIGVSSTDIRERVQFGKSIRYMVPDCVGDYIEKNGLYK